MAKLTACGTPFGKGSVEHVPGSYDFMWKHIKKAIVDSGILEEVRATSLEYGVTRYTSKLVMVDMLRKNFPEGLPEEDFNRYLDELLDLIYEDK